MNKLGSSPENKDLLPILNQGDVLKGTLQLRCRDVTHYVGADNTFEFGKNIKLPDGEFLKVSHNDLLYRVHIVIKSSDGTSKSLFEFLPSCLFTEARSGDTLTYFKGTQKYELHIIPSTNGISNPEEFSFDECIKTVELARDKPTTDFCRLEDVPRGYGYTGITNKHTGIFHTAKIPTDGSFLISRHGQFYTLSPNTTQIQINQTGVFPVNFEKLKFIYCDAERSNSHTTQDETGFFIKIEAAGRPELEMLLDKNKIYVTHKPSGIYADFTTSFYHNAIETGLKKIDQSKITATLDDTGILFINIPFASSPNEQTLEMSTTSSSTTSSVKPTETSIDLDNEPIDFDAEYGISTTSTTSTTATSSVMPVIDSLPSNVWVNTACDVGFENTLGVCCEPSWNEAPIAFTHNGTNWSGQVPTGKDWKFVILQNGHVIKWENGNNRKCDGNVNSLSINPNELHFG